MTARGHYLTALSLGVIGSVLIAGDYYSGNWISAIADVITWSAESIGWGFYSPPPAVIAFTFFCGCAFGAWAPDWLEFSYIYNNFRKSLIPHRTITHTVVLWLILSVVSFYLLYETSHWTYITTWFFFGFNSAGLLHCLVDMFSPTGVPIFKPFKKFSIPFYRTGEASELKIIVPIMFLAVITVIINPAY